MILGACWPKAARPLWTRMLPLVFVAYCACWLHVRSWPLVKGNEDAGRGYLALLRVKYRKCKYSKRASSRTLLAVFPPLPVFKPWRTRYESLNYGISNYQKTIRNSTPRFTRFPSLVLIRLVLTEIQRFENVKINRDSYLVLHGLKTGNYSLHCLHHITIVHK